jgi:hypothetical protein
MLKPAVALRGVPERVALVIKARSSYEDRAHYLL